MSANDYGDAAGDASDGRGRRASGPPELVFSRAVLARIWAGQHRLRERLRNAGTASGGRRNG